ncbi:MAG: shikimate kinase [Phycisphaerae bacterium]
MTESAPKNIVLIGYRGCGKSTVGQRLAQRLGRPFVDTDELIEQEAGMSIADIFAAEGQVGFRGREVAVIERIARQTGQVIAVGGGAVTDPRNAQRLKAGGTLIWLTAPADVLWQRIERDSATYASRPDLTATGGLAEVRQVLADREPIYRALADLVLDTQGQSIEQIVEACSPNKS